MKLRCTYRRIQRVLISFRCIDAGAEVEIRNNYGYSPLHYACLSGALDVVKMLVRAGAGVRAQTDAGETCLAYALISRHIATIRYLVGLLPDVDVNHLSAHNHILRCTLQCLVITHPGCRC